MLARRWIGVFLATAMGSACVAQTPEVTVKLDMRLHYRTGKDEPTVIRFYDTLARPSTVALAIALEPGFRAYLSERFERIPHDGDPEQMDEYYLEDPGLWRIGKQVLPFGRESLLRMNAKAARGEATLAFRYLPAKVAICDDGEGLTRGVVGRVGSRLGLSFAVGRNLATSSTCLAVFRRPEDAPGKGRGYQQAYGADYSRRWGAWTMQAEYVMLRQGETAQDANQDVSDLVMTLEPSKYQSFVLGWSHAWSETLDVYRLEGRFLAARNVWVEPIVRYRNGVFYDMGVSLRVKL